ncbi:MAG: MBL fold metallo-hydrolase [Minisyncoccia bacterium]
MNHIWNIGSAKITAIVEVEAGDIVQSGMPDATPENVKRIAWLQPHFADTEGNLKGVVQTFGIEIGGKKILVDTCIGNAKERTDLPTWNNLQTDFLARLEAAGFSRESVDIVICTHIHCDHVGWNTMRSGNAWVPTFPNARYLFVQGEFDYWKERPAVEIPDDHAGFADSVLPIFESGLADFVAGNHRVLEGVSLMPTPGHTPHHVCVKIESEGTSAIITGDVLHHPCQLAHPEWKVLWDTDKEMAIKTRHDFFQTCANSGILVIGSHFSAPTVGHIVRDGTAYTFKTEERGEL